jgi:hypothetical protein
MSHPAERPSFSLCALPLLAPVHPMFQTVDAITSVHFPPLSCGRCPQPAHREISRGTSRVFTAVPRGGPPRRDSPIRPPKSHPRCCSTQSRKQTRAARSRVREWECLHARTKHLRRGYAVWSVMSLFAVSGFSRGFRILIPKRIILSPIWMGRVWRRSAGGGPWASAALC